MADLSSWGDWLPHRIAALLLFQKLGAAIDWSVYLEGDRQSRTKTHRIPFYRLDDARLIPGIPGSGQNAKRTMVFYKRSDLMDFIRSKKT